MDFEMLNLHPGPVEMEPENLQMEFFTSIGNSLGV